jgi:hypothetical protein
MSRTYRSSKPCSWVRPRPFQDASLRYRTHGPILPMEYPKRSLVQRIKEMLP